MPRAFRKLILIALDWTRPKDPPISLGQASIVANALKHNVPIISQSWAVNQPTFTPTDVVRFVKQHETADTAVALGGYIWNEHATQHIIKQLKHEKFAGPIILGGPQVSYTGRGIEKFYSDVDIFVRGYAEKALIQLAQTEYKDNKHVAIRGVHYAGEPDLGLSASIDLETLPSPYLTGLIEPQRFIRWETQRGCPFTCAFCQHREATPMKERKTFALSRVIEEAHWITSNSIIQDVAVVDPTFNSGNQYLSVLEALAHGKYSGKIALQCRAEMVTPQFLDAVQRINKHGHVVLEFGLQTVHKEEQKHITRPNNMTKISQVLSEAHARGIAYEVSLIFGLPAQTVSSFQESIDFCRKHQAPVIHAFPLMLLRGTPLHNDKDALQLVESSTEAPHQLPRIQENIPHVISSPSFSYADWKTMAKMAESLEAEYNTISQQKLPPLRFSTPTIAPATASIIKPNQRFSP